MSETISLIEFSKNGEVHITSEAEKFLESLDENLKLSKILNKKVSFQSSENIEEANHFY